MKPKYSTFLINPGALSFFMAKFQAGALLFCNYHVLIYGYSFSFHSSHIVDFCVKGDFDLPPSRSSCRRVVSVWFLFHTMCWSYRIFLKLCTVMSVGSSRFTFIIIFRQCFSKILWRNRIQSAYSKGKMSTRFCELYPT